MSESVTFHLNKLVRDKLPDAMRQMGQEPEVKTLSGEELQRALIAKVGEELAELDPDSPEYKKELADLKQAVIDLIALSDPDEIERLRLEMLEKKGGFETGAYISRLTLRPDDEWIEYYRREPQKYPEENA